MSSFNRRKFIQSAMAVAATSTLAGCAASSSQTTIQTGNKTVMGLTVPSMTTVRVGFIGVGERGVGAVRHFCHIDGVEIKAICEIRKIEKILIFSRKEKTAIAAITELASMGIFAEYAEAETVCRNADILVTVTGAREALFDTQWIKPGTHISAMGADHPGKQELPVPLVLAASLFADHPPQSRVNGEFEMAALSELSLNIVPIGAVLNGDQAGRISEEEVTIFDSSGIALQDLCVAQSVLEKAIEVGLAEKVDF